VVLLLAVSALCVYLSRRGLLRLARLYEEYCAQRVFHLLGQNPAVCGCEDQNVLAKLSGLVSSDARMIGRVLRVILPMIVPLISLIVALAALFHLQLWLTLMISAMVAVMTFFQMRISLIAARQSMRFEKYGSEAKREYKQLFSHIKYQPRIGDNRLIVQKAFARGAVKNRNDAFEGRLRAREESALVSGVFTALIVGLIMLIMGVGIIRQGAGWERLLVYVAALKFAMNGVQRTFFSITTVNRFYPQLQRYFLFIQSAQPVDEKDISLPETYNVRVDENSEHLLPASSVSTSITTGFRLALVTSVKLDRYSLSGLVGALLGGDDKQMSSALHAMGFATSRHSCPDCSIRELLHLAEATKLDDLPLSGDMLARVKSALPNNLDKSMKAAAWEQMEPNVRLVVSILSAANSDCQWLFVEDTDLQLLDAEHVLQPLLDHAARKGKIVVIVFNKMVDRVGIYGEGAVAVTYEGEMIGLGDTAWFASVQAQAAELLALKLKAQQEIEDDDGDELGDEEM
jgi:hypothetical protein